MENHISKINIIHRGLSPISVLETQIVIGLYSKDIFAEDRKKSSYETSNGRANNGGTIIPMVFNVEAINLLDFDINII